MGVGILPCFVADAERSLVRLFPVLTEIPADLWLVVHVDLRRNARVRAFVDFVHEGLTAMRARLEG